MTSHFFFFSIFFILKTYLLYILHLFYQLNLFYLFFTFSSLFSHFYFLFSISSLYSSPSLSSVSSSYHPRHTYGLPLVFLTLCLPFKERSRSEALGLNTRRYKVRDISTCVLQRWVRMRGVDGGGSL